MKKSAFTIVELLVVIFILLIAVAILLPVFQRATRPRPSCQHNLKLIALGFKQYVLDWNDKLPKSVLNDAVRTKAEPHLAYGWADTLQPYVKSIEIFQCPDEEKQGGGYHEPWEAGYTDYYFNSRLSGQSDAKFRHAESTILMGEGNDGVDVNNARYTRNSIPQKWLQDTASPAYRILDGANYVFLDGHVKWLSARDHPTLEPATGSNFTFAP